MMITISNEPTFLFSRVLHLILFKCEWFLAQINQLRNELPNNSRKKHHLRSICLNSMKYIDELLLLSQSSDQVRLEYLAYCNLFKGIVKNELKEFSTAHNSLEKSKIIIEELIKNPSNPNSILERKLNEIETIMRVCQYSADMYDIVIERDLNSDDFKMDQLTNDLKKSEIKETVVTIKFGSNTFKLSPSILISDPIYKKVQLSRKLLQSTSSSSRSSNEKNLLLQAAYFENRHLSKIIKGQLTKKNKNKNQHQKFDCEKLLQIISRSKGYAADPNYSKTIDLLCNLLKSVKDCDPVGTLEAFELIKENKKCFEEYKKTFMRLILKNQKLIISNLPRAATSTEISHPTFICAAPVPPKPSFYDMAFDCLTAMDPDLEHEHEIEIETASNPKAATSLTNLLSSFWGNKK